MKCRYHQVGSQMSFYKKRLETAPIPRLSQGLDDRNQTTPPPPPLNLMVWIKWPSSFSFSVSLQLSVQFISTQKYMNPGIYASDLQNN